MKKLIDFIKKKIWPIIVIVSTIFGLLGGYSFFFERKNTSLEYQIMSQISALDVKENLKNLDIIYNGRNLIESKENIAIFTIRLINNGNQIIKENDYASGEFGLKISNGTLIESPKTSFTSNQYLRENVKVSIIGKNQINLSKLILEPNENLVFKMYVLSNVNAKTELKSVGKIAGIKDGIKVILNTGDKSEPFISKSIYGNVKIQFFRFFIYGISMIMFLVLILVCWYYTEKYFELRKKKKWIKEFKTTQGYKPIDKPIYDKYLSSDDSNIHRLFSIHYLSFSAEQLNYVYNRTDISERNVALEENTEGLSKKNIQILLELGVLDNNFKVIEGRKELLYKFRDFIYKKEA